jgi:hypothetical protein
MQNTGCEIQDAGFRIQDSRLGLTDRFSFADMTANMRIYRTCPHRLNSHLVNPEIRCYELLHLESYILYPASFILYSATTLAIRLVYEVHGATASPVAADLNIASIVFI